jgi:hypothetical protein
MVQTPPLSERPLRRPDVISHRPYTGGGYGTVEAENNTIDGFESAFDLEEPLRKAGHVVTALRLMGHGMARLDSDGGDAVVHLAWAASKRLDTLKELWDEAHNVAAGRK